MSYGAGRNVQSLHIFLFVLFKGHAAWSRNFMLAGFNTPLPNTNQPRHIYVCIQDREKNLANAVASSGPCPVQLR